MARKVIGPTGSRRRRWWFLLCLVVTVGAGVLFIPGALAVHATGIFQLDGNADQSIPSGYPTNVEDWDNVCAAHLQTVNNDNQPGEFCHPVDAGALPSATTAGRSTFITDSCCSASSDNIFKGGTDDGPITPGDSGIPSGSPWQWKEAVPSPDKADIEQAFAAQYTCDTGASGALCNNAFYEGDNILYFGGTRQAKNGDTNIAFWFLRNDVTLCGDGAVGNCGPGETAPTCPVNSGCTFTGTHHVGNVTLGGSLGEGCNPNPDPDNNVCDPGDLFIQSSFTSKPSITIYEWVGYGNANPCITSNCDLNQVVLPANATGDNTCSTSATDNDPACALTNDTSVASPWFFTDKTAHSPANTFGTGSNGGELYEGGVDLSKLGFGDECISTFMLNTRSSGSSVNSTDQDLAIGHMGGCSSTLTTSAGANAAGLTIDNGATSANGTVNSGMDTATVTVTGVGTWDGTVDFYLCGPVAASDATTPGKCDSGGVKLNGTSDNSAVPVDQATNVVNSGSATLTSAGRYCWYAHFTSNKSGVDSQDEDGTSDTPVTGTSDPNPECFTVSPVTPTLKTCSGTFATSPDNTCTPPSAATPFGSAVNDTARLSGAAKEPGSNGGSYDDTVGCTTPPCSHTTTYTTINATDGAFQGSIGFTLKGPDGGGATGGTPNCTDNASAYTGETQTFPISDAVTGNGDYTASFTPGSPGDYHWVARYAYEDTATPPNNLAVNNNLPLTFNGNCLEGDEDVTVQQIPTTTKTVQSWVPNDTATVTADQSGGGEIQGTVRFQLFPNADCNASGEGDTALYDHTFGDSDNPLVADSTTHEIVVHTATTHDPVDDTAYPNTTAITKSVDPTTGYPTVSWLVTFTPVNDPAHTGSSNLDSSDVCDEQTTLSITDSPTS